jgi:RNA polymerase sigma factor (sigma-70 family)
MPPSSHDLNQLLAEADWLRNLALHLAGSQDQADDLVQETWVAALRNPPADAGKARAWLSSVARNLHRMKLRGEKRRHRREQDTAGQDWSDPDDALVQIESQKILADAILELDSDSRDLVVWFYFDQQSVDQISTRLGIGDAAVRQRLSRIRKRLRLQLANRFGQNWRHRTLAAFPTGKFLLASLIPIMNTASWNKFIVPLAVAILFGAYALLSGNLSESLPKNEVAQANFEIAKDAEFPNDRSMAEELAQPNTQVADLPLKNEHPLLKGIIQTANGQPIPGAEIKVIQPLDRQIPGLGNYWEANELELSQTKSNEDGFFELQVAGNLRFDLVCTAGGFASSRKFDLGVTDWITVVLDPEAEIWGKVADDETGFGIPDVVVKIRPGPLSTGVETYDTTTNEEGEYRIKQLRAGFYTMRVYSASHPSMENRVVPIPILQAGEPTRIDIKLDRGVSISGRVTHATLGTPIENATALLRMGGGAFIATTDPDGYFDLYAPRAHAQHQVRFSASGFGSFQYRLVDGSVDGQEVYVALLPSRSAVGQIIDPQGNPIAGVKIAAASSAISSDFGQQTDSQTAISNLDGRFEIGDLRPELRHTLLLAHSQFSTEVFDFPLGELESETVNLGQLVLHPPASIQGKVLAPNGDPLQGIHVLLNGEPARRDDLGPMFAPGVGYKSGEGIGYGRIRCVTDHQGEFSFYNLPAGSFHLSAGKKGYLHRGSYTAHLTRGQSLLDAEIVLDKGLSIQGVIHDANGVPMPAAKVTAYKPMSTDQLVYTLADTDGHFELWGLEPGSYRIGASSGFNPSRPQRARPWIECLVEDVAAGTDDLGIALPDLSSVKGTVVGPTNKPVFGAIIELGQSSDTLISTTISTDQNGEFELFLPADQSFTLDFWPPVGAADGIFRPLYDENGKIDQSLSVTIEGVNASQSPLTVQLPKLPPLNSE